MRKVVKYIFFSIFLFFGFFSNNIFAQNTLSEEQITLFKTDVELEENTDINIIEEIHYYFPTSRHGIIREIPIDYKVQAGFKRPTTLTLNDVYYYKDGFPETKYSEYERSTKNGYAIFQIGDAETTIQGEYVYVISYTLKNAVNYFDDYDELYLNISGNGWSIPIQQAYANITVPGEITDKVCFTGTSGSEESNCTFEQISSNSIKVTVDSSLEALEGYTVAVKMPKGTLENTSTKQFFAFLVSNIGILIPVPIFILLSRTVKKKGKNKKITIIPHYEPEKDMYPLLAGYIYSKVLNNKHITAQIIQSAIDGYIKIKQEGKRKYLLIKNKFDEESILDTTKTLLDGLFKKKFEVNTKSISSDFYITVRNLNTKLNSEVYSENYFDKDRRKLKSKMLVFGIVIFFISIGLMAPLAFIAAGSWAYGILISALLMVIFSFKVDIRGKKGNELYYELEGLKMYINTAEKHRIEFHNDPEKYQEVFETLLPYAIIFGLEKKWAKEFEDIYKEPPSWYEGNINTFNAYVLANSIGSISKNVQSKSVAPNSAGGFASSHGASGGSGFSGGSSGGGFGGGGGGSW